MIVDLSHVSDNVMEAVLNISQAPVIFSHSSARALCNHPRNVDDKILDKLVSKIEENNKFKKSKKKILERKRWSYNG